MNKKILSLVIVCSGILTSGAIIGLAYAQTTPSTQSQSSQSQGQQPSVNIKYPISELGNCSSQADCKVFCDDPKNSDACLAFAEKNNLMSSDQVSAAKKFKDAGMVGPGGCNGKTECDTYCNDASHMEECVTFAQKTD